MTAWAIVTDLTNVANVHSRAAQHIDQADLNALPPRDRFTEAFEVGDELFATAFNALDGGGANVDGASATRASLARTCAAPVSGLPTARHA